MKLKKLILLTVSLLLLNSMFAQNNRYSLIDDLGKQISFDKVPERVITLAPSLTEFVYKLGCKNKLMGNTEYCNYPPEAKSITKVGDMLTFDFEKILSLKPDLILITIEGNTKEVYTRLLELGLKVFVINPRNYEGIKNSFIKVAEIFKKETIANSVVNDWDKRVNTIIRINKERQSQTAMVVVELSSLMLAGQNTFLNEYLNLCNLQNIAADSPLNYPVFNREEIIKRNPDYIIYPSSGNENSNYLLEYYPEWKELKAMKEGRVIFVNRDMYFRPGPRFVESLEDLSNKLK